MSYKSEAEKSLDRQYYWFMGVGTVYSIVTITLVSLGVLPLWILVISGIIWGLMGCATQFRIQDWLEERKWRNN